MQSRISHTFDMAVTCAMWHDEYGYGGPALVATDGDLNEVVIEGLDRDRLVQMFRNAFCANDAPTNSEISAMPEHTKRMLLDIRNKIKSYPALKTD